jgi:hypothetical protein
MKTTHICPFQSNPAGSVCCRPDCALAINSEHVSGWRCGLFNLSPNYEVFAKAYRPPMIQEGDTGEEDTE